MAGGKLRRAAWRRQQCWGFDATDILCLATAGMKHATRWWRQRARHFAANGAMARTEPANTGYRIKERLRVGMRWLRK